MYEFLQNFLASAWHGLPAATNDPVLDVVTAGDVSERLHRDLDACFQAIHEQISEPKQ
ncbi:hypothetical protein QEZ47_19830 [Aminobacter anthyllidis]|uniref:hypothetical protein n=1 Tax=Aminobacter anthyllidis TaxID=1035067 RepID=UPI002457C8B5|nr:hypothetical protein [Aminobacter anthyllidis]MDH4987729.1 hypothetical protein [Aminobacter anthyllidis]